jgi:nitric oxide reductase large subunit
MKSETWKIVMCIQITAMVMASISASASMVGHKHHPFFPGFSNYGIRSVLRPVEVLPMYILILRVFLD